MANGALVVVYLCTLTTTAFCEDMSNGLAKISELTESATIDFGDNSSDAESILPEGTINRDSEILNGSFCQQAYACHYASVAEAASIVLGCSCHDYCAIFGDCCSDKISFLPPSEPERFPRASLACAPSYLFKHSVYMITSCPESYDDRSIAGYCSNFTDFSASSMDIRWTPVTDIVTGATFRNVYCAICWGKTRRHVATWLWRLTCPETGQGSFAWQAESDYNISSGAAASDSALSDESSAANYVRNTCHLTFDPPKLNTSLHFCPENAITDCGLGSSATAFNRELLTACLNGPARYVYDERGIPYWNSECARCRRWPGEPDLSCQKQVVDGVLAVPGLSLSIILTPDSGDCTAAASGTQSSSDGWTPEALCRGLRGCHSEGGGRGWTPGCQSKPLATARCSGAAAALSGAAFGRECAASASELVGKCTFSDSPPSTATAASAQSTVWLNSSAADGVAVLAVTLIDNATLCYHCTTTRYENFTVANRSLVVASLTGVPSQSFDYPMYVIEEGVATVCVELLLQSSVESVTSGDGGCAAVPAFVSALFLCLSEAAFVVFFAAFARVRALRRFPGEMVLNESAAFFLAFLFFLLRPLVGSFPVACTALAVLIHYFLLAAFAWTALYSMEIASALSFRVSEGASKRRRAVHYGLAWGVPLVCVAIGLSADESALEFRPLYGPPQCFIGSRLGNLTLFMAPLCIFLTVDIVVYVFMIVKLAIIARQTKSVRSSHREKLWLSVKLVLSMGLLWLFAVLASFTQSAAFYCVFSLLNSLQGLFVFAVFVCKRDILVALGRKSKASTTTTTTSAVLSSRTRSTMSAASS